MPSTWVYHDGSTGTGCSYCVPRSVTNGYFIPLKYLRDSRVSLFHSKYFLYFCILISSVKFLVICSAPTAWGHSQCLTCSQKSVYEQMGSVASSYLLIRISTRKVVFKFSLVFTYELLIVNLLLNSKSHVSYRWGQEIFRFSVMERKGARSGEGRGERKQEK